MSAAKTSSAGSDRLALRRAPGLCTPAAWLCVALLVALAGCDTSPPSLRSRVNSKRSQLASQKSKLAAATSGGSSGASSYLKALRDESGGERAYHVLLPPKELSRGAKAVLPYSFPAQSMNKDLSGTMTAVSASGFTMGKDNRLTFKLLLRGKGLKYTGRTAGYASHVKKIKAGLAKGLDVDVRARVWVEGGKVKVRLLATSVRLRKHASSRYHSMLKGALNKYLFKKPFTVTTGSLSAGGSQLRAFRALVTGNQVVISLK